MVTTNLIILALVSGLAMSVQEPSATNIEKVDVIAGQGQTEVQFDDYNRINEYVLVTNSEKQKEEDILRLKEEARKIAEQKEKEKEKDEKEKAEAKAKAEEQARIEQEERAAAEAAQAEEEGQAEANQVSSNNSSMDGTPTGTVLTMESTAYSSDPADSLGGGTITATGQNLLENPIAVAVDPNVIPLGTKLYVEGYGTAYAVDTGGAIKGNIIDVHFPTYEQCIQWGRRTVQVTILE